MYVPIAISFFKATQVILRMMDPVHTSHDGEENTVDVLQLIFSACDTQNTGLVHVSKLVEYIQPYLPENLRALDDLKSSLDPECKDVFVTNDQFFKVMSGWCHKLTTQSSEAGPEMDNIPSASVLLSDDKHSPVKHSTPRASLRDELLKCKDLLNISNISGYSLSSSQLEHSVGQDSTVLEEEIKKLKHQVSKLSSELVSVRYQLSLSEDQNEQLQQDLEKINRQLHAEQLVNEHLHKDIKQNEELQEEFNNIKKEFIDMKQNLRQSEKNSLYYKKLVTEIENEKLKLEKEVGVYFKQNQDYLKEVFEVKIECETKEQEINELTKKLKGLKCKMSDLQDIVDQLANENELLKYQKLTLKSALNTKSKPSSSSETNLASERQREGEKVNTRNINQSFSEAFDWRSEENVNLHPLQEEMFEADMKYLVEEAAQNMTLEEQMQQLQMEKIEAESTLLAIMERISRVLEQQDEVSQDPKNEHFETQNMEVVGPKPETSNVLRIIYNAENVAEVIHFHLSSKNAVIQELKKLNEILRAKLVKAESDLGDKIDTVLRFKNELSNCIGVNNTLWRNVKTLRHDLHSKLIKLNKLIQSNNELNINYSNLLLVHDAQLNKNGILCKFLEICKQKREEVVETCIALREQVNQQTEVIKQYENDIERLKAALEKHTLTNQDSTSKTDETGLKINAGFIKIKAESDRILEELNCKLDDEIIKNKELTQDLKDLREKYLEVDSELLQIKQTLADSEVKTDTKLQESVEKYDSSSAETMRIVDIIKEKDFLLKKVEEESLNRLLMMKDFEEKLNQELQKNGFLTQDIKERNQSYQKLTEEMWTLREDLEKKQAEIIRMENEFKTRLDAENGRNSTLFNKLEEVTQKYSALIESSSHAQEANAKLALKLGETDQKIQELQKELDDRKTECASLLDQLPLIQASKFQLEEQKRALTEIVETLTSQNSELVLQVALSKVEKDTLNCEISRLQLSCSKHALENDNFKTELSKMRASVCSHQKNTKKSSFSKQQIKLDKLQNKIDDLEEKLKRVTAEKSQLAMQSNREQDSRCEANAEFASLMKNVSTSADQLNLELEAKKTVEVSVQVTRDVDVEVKCGNEAVALVNVSDCRDSALDAELLDSTTLNQNLSTKLRFTLNSETVLEVPALDVSNFAECIEELGLNCSKMGEQLKGNESEKEELERIATALMLWLSNNSSNVSRSIDNQTEKYRNQYKALLYLLSDISYRLRNHLYIETLEPIVPVYELLEEVKLELKAVVQCASQIGALICENRMERCCKFLINYCALLSHENERLRNKSRPFISCVMGGAGILAIALFAFGISMAINFTCRMMTEDDKYCPFDSGVKRINIGEPPM
ncbi:putative leucine-rich repeat-containing protein DDB_G0290503 isoform X2 [Euwallacea similis]|uniref:putative leucine-rich repeat-containing protein DDB_G0290503 isoform X2 n=1 Tax=Euwallacea similis TaxID=1736056 RepID=UPI00344F010E